MEKGRRSRGHHHLSGPLLHLRDAHAAGVYFLKKAAKIESGAKAPGRDKVGKVTKAQVKEIAEKKMADLNCDTVESAMRMVEGSARSMGIEVAG